MAPTLTSPDMPVRMKRSGLDGEEQPPEQRPVARHRDLVQSELPGCSPEVLEFCQTPEGRFGARFSFDFVGMTRTRSIQPERSGEGEASGTNPDAAFQSLVKVLGPGDSLTFTFATAGKRHLQWKLSGAVKDADSMGLARIQGQGLFEAVHSLLVTLGGCCRFHARSVPEQRTENVAAPASHVYRLTPRPALVEAEKSKGPLGFQASVGSCENSKVRLSVPTTLPASGISIPELVATASAPMCVAVSIERVSLSERQHGALARTVESLQADVGRGSHSSAHCRGHAGPHPESLAKLGEELLKHGGVRLRCHALAGHPLSSSWLSFIGQEIFGSAIVVSEGGESEAAREDEHALEEYRPLSARSPKLFLDESAAERVAVSWCFEPDKLALPDSGIVLGHLADGQLAHAVRLHDSCRSRHCYVIGATGTGKSTLLYNLIQQDICAGEGVALLDPHGDLFEQVLAAIPKHRAKDVVILDPADPERAVGLNFLELSGANRAREEAFIVSELLSCFDRMYDMRQCGGPGFEQYFRNSLLLLMSAAEVPPTLLDVPRVFEDRDWRKSLLQRCPNPQVNGFWQMAQATTGDQALGNYGPYITNKLSAFTHHAVLRPIIGQRVSTIRFREVMDRRQILLVNLSKGALGERDAQFLGMLVFAKLSQAALSRFDLPPAKRTPFHLYVDEFQNLATNSIGVMLAEARKFGVSLTLANQNTAQLAKAGDSLLETVLGNVGSLVAFRLGVPDAERLRPYFAPELGAADLQRMGNYLAAARLMKPHGPTAPFIFQSLPPEPPKFSVTRPARLRRLRHRYTEPVAEVERDIARRFGNSKITVS